MKNKETLISYWTDYLVQKNMDKYHAKETAMIIADEIEEFLNSLDKQAISEFEYNLKESTDNAEWVLIKTDYDMGNLVLIRKCGDTFTAKRSRRNEGLFDFFHDKDPSIRVNNKGVIYKTLINESGEFIAIQNNEFYISDTPIIQPESATIDLMKELYRELPFEDKKLVNISLQLNK